MVDNFLHISREDIRKTWGKPLKHSDSEVRFDFIINTVGEFLEMRSHLSLKKIL